MIAFEIWWLAGNVVGAIGLYNVYQQHHGNFIVTDQEDKHQQQRRKQQQQQLEQHYYRKALLCFSICGTLQCYNATIYLFLSYYLSGFSHVPNHPLSMATFWGLNGFWACASAIASYFASSLLLRNYNGSSSSRLMTEYHKSKTM